MLLQFPAFLLIYLNQYSYHYGFAYNASVVYIRQTHHAGPRNRKEVYGRWAEAEKLEALVARCMGNELTGTG